MKNHYIISIDLNNLNASSNPTFKRGDRFPLQIRFTKGIDSVELPSSTVGRIVFKLENDYSGDFVIRFPWRKFGRGNSAYYYELIKHVLYMFYEF